MSPSLQRYCLWIACGLGLLNLAIMVRWHQPAPHFDMVDVEAFLTQWSLARDGLGPVVTYPDNEHRSFLPLLLQALDHNAFSSRGIFLAILHATCFAGLAGIIALHLRLSFAATRYALLAAAGGIVVMVWSEHWYNISRLKQTHLCLALVSMAGAFWALAAAHVRATPTRPASWILVLAAGALLINAGWSFAAGLAALPGVIAFMAAGRFSWAQRGAVLASGVFVVVTRNWASAAANSPTAASPEGADLVTQLHYAANFVGGFSRRALGGDEVIAPVLGLVGLVIAGPLLWRALGRVRADADTGASHEAHEATTLVAQRQGAGFFAMLMIWTLICAIGITPNRAHFGADQAFVGRYLIFSVTFWLAALGMIAATGWPSGSKLRRGIMIAAGVFLGLFVVMQPRGWLKLMEHERRVALGAVTAAVDVTDVQYVLAPPSLQGNLETVIDDYQVRQASFLARRWGGWLGDRVTSHFTPADPGRCDGVTADVWIAQLDGGGWRVGGRVAGRSPVWIAIVDGQTIVGLARRGERFTTPPVGAVSGDVGGSGADYAGFAGTPRRAASPQAPMQNVFQVVVPVARGQGCFLDVDGGAGGTVSSP